MKINSKRITGNLFIVSDLQYNDVAAENITVKDGINTRIYGVINKNLVIGKNAIVYLHGKVLGEVKNNGGVVYLFDPFGNVTTL